jgi:anti-repressor protein
MERRNMNEITLTNQNGQSVVSSRQVAENFGKEHRDVLESVRNILAAENSATRFFHETTYENRGKEYPEYLMNRDGFTLLAMGFTGSEAMQWKIKYIQAFNEMEKQLQPSFKIPQTLSQALMLAANQAAQIEEQTKQLTEAQPKIDFFDAVADSKNAIEIGAVAKVLDFPSVGRNKLFEILRDQKVLMANNQPYQRYIDCRYFRVIEQKFNKPNGDIEINIKTLVYQKGVEYIRRLLDEQRVAVQIGLRMV